jgi:transposase
MRGMDMIGAITFLAELGDLSRFENPRQVMAYLGLTVDWEAGARSLLSSLPTAKAGRAGATFF